MPRAFILLGRELLAGMPMGRLAAEVPENSLMPTNISNLAPSGSAAT